MAPRLMTIAAAARILQMTTQAVGKRLDAGTLKGLTVAGKRLVTRASVERVAADKAALAKALR